MNYKQVCEIAQEYDKKIRSDDPRLRNSVLIIHDEGTVLFIRFAFAIIVDSEYVMVFAEHHQSHVYSLDEASFVMFKEIPYKEIERFEYE